MDNSNQPQQPDQPTPLQPQPQPEYQSQPQPQFQTQPEPQPTQQYQPQPDSQPQPAEAQPQFQTQQAFQQAPQQPTEPAPQPQFATPTAPVNQKDPGKTLGIVGFVFAFIGLQVVGLILSILGFKKSKKAGFKNTLAFAGIILNAIGLLLAIILIPILFSMTMASYQGISERANQSVGIAYANDAAKRAELFKADSGTYPSSYSVIADDSKTILSASPLTAEPSEPATIEFNTCGADGNKIGYWDYSLKSVSYVYTGDATEYSTCMFSAS